MKELDASQIALVAPSGEGVARERIDLLRGAGAVVRVCEPSQDLWSALSEVAFDLILILTEPDATASLALYDHLKRDARTRAIPALLVTAQLTRAAERGALALSTDVTGDALIRAVCDAIVPLRRLREAEQQERSLREQLRSETTRATVSGQQLADLAHELRATLDAMLGFACNLRDELPGPMLPDQKTHVAGIIKAVERATKLLDKARSPSLMAMPRVSVAPASAPPRGQRTLVHIGRIALEVAALFEAVAMRKSLRLPCACDDSVCVWGDALKLKQVLTNLVVNALKYTPDGGEVSISVRWSSPSEGGGVEARRAAEIIVADTGPGIAPEHRQRIFERGFRIEPRTAVPGEGIGLSVVKELVTQHGGTITVEGELGTGAVFKVSLPQDRRQRARTNSGGWA
jgi:signal transduction histidine kinase